MQPTAETLMLLERLIAFDTVSARSNRALIDHVADYLGRIGITARILPSDDGVKANLWATIGPNVDGGVILSGHSDVVPVEGQPWSSDPFGMIVRDGHVYGRGACDMKGFIACVLASAARNHARPLARPIHIALTYDEEVGCIGAPRLLDWLGRRTPRPAIAFIGEPTSMQVVNAHKGILVAETRIEGVEAHSSLAHLGISAIALAARAMTLLQRIEAETAETLRDERFEPDRTTISVNRIAGGTALNILAGQATFGWDIRAIPGGDARAILARFETLLEAEIIAPARRDFPGVGASTHILADAPPLRPEPGGRGEALATRLIGTNRAGAVPYAAEAGQFQASGLATVIIGPGSIEQAHKADEYVTLDQLARCDAFLDRLWADLSS